VRITASTFGRAWLALVHALMDDGKRVSPRQQGTREIIGVQFHVTNGLSNILNVEQRKMNYRFALAEFLWIWFGRGDVASIARYNSIIKDFSDDGIYLEGAYGPKIRPQWDAIRQKLQDDPDTRQAVLQIYQDRFAALKTKDTPCTLSIQFFRRAGGTELRTVVSMRSSDVWLGLPYDFYAFSMLANVMAAELGITVGDVTMNLGSSHLYDRNVDGAVECLKPSNRSATTLESPILPSRPPALLEGHFLQLADPAPMESATWTLMASALSKEKAPTQADVLRMISR
jgi:thymidylate synthase